MEKLKAIAAVGLFCLICQLIGSAVLGLFGVDNRFLAAPIGSAILMAVAPVRRCGKHDCRGSSPESS